MARSVLVAVCVLAVSACATPAAPTATPTPTPTATATATAAVGTSTPGPPAARPAAPGDFVALSDVDGSIAQDIRYAGAHNFIGRPIAGYLEPTCLLTRRTAEALHRVQQAARARGYRVKVYDCYRPQRAVDDFVAWAKDEDDLRMKAEFYPHVDKARLFELGYIGAPSAHSRGTTVDVTLVPDPPPAQRPFVPGEPLVACTAPVGQRFGDNSIDMGTGYDCFDPRARTMDPRARTANRLLLRQLMTGAGFTNYAGEWWHYTLASAPGPVIYYDFPVAGNSVATR